LTALENWLNRRRLDSTMIEIGLSIFGASVVIALVLVASQPNVPFYVMLFGLTICVVGVLVDSFS
jgi:hypothetical protein